MGGGGREKQVSQTYQPYVNTGIQRSQETYDYGKNTVGDLDKFYSGVMSGEIGGGGGGGNVYIPQELTPEQIADLEGTYREYNTTGGWGDQRTADFRGRAIGAADAPYQQAQRQAAVGQAVQGGGWGSGVNTANLALLREGARERNQALLGAETERARSIDEGRKWGAGGLSEALKYRVGRQDQIGEARAARANAAAGAARQAFEDRMRGAKEREGLIDTYGRAGLPYYEAAGKGLGGWGGLEAERTKNRNSMWQSAIGAAAGLGGSALQMGGK